MPFIKNEERKQSFLEDIGKMFTESTTLSQGKKNPDFLKNFTSAKAYFEKQKGDDAQKLAGYMQNFINVYNLQKNAGNNPTNAQIDDMVINIQSMSGDFKKHFDSYIGKNGGFSALKNSNVKLLSSMVQTADDMSHRVDVEDRVEFIGSVKERFSNERRVNANIQKEYEGFINNCVVDGIDFVDTDSQLSEYEQKLAESSKTLESLQNTYDAVTSGKDSNKKDLEEVEQCVNDLLAFDTKLKAANEKMQAIDNLRNSLRKFKDESQDSSKEIEGHRKYIQECTEKMASNQEAINAESLKAAEYEKAINRKRELEGNQISMFAEMASLYYTNFEEAFNALNLMATNNEQPSKYINNPNPDTMARIWISQYENMKDTLCNQLPDLAGEFEMLESDPSYSIRSILDKNKADLSNTRQELINDMENAKNDPDYLEYLEVSKNVSELEASSNNIKSLSSDQTFLQNQIKLHNELIETAKITGGFGKQIKDALGYIPEIITQKELITTLTNEFVKTKAERDELENSPEPKSIKDRMEKARQNAENKDLVKLSDKLTKAKTTNKKIEEKYNNLKKYSAEHKKIKAKSDNLINDRNIVKESDSRIGKVHPNKEIFERLTQIRKRFEKKTNHKMNPDCQNMITQLDHTIELFDPNKEENVNRFTEQQEALAQLNTLSGKYIDKKNGQHIPTWFASEQRLLRLSCAEEMQQFSKTAQGIITDAQRLGDDLYTSYNFAVTEYGDRQKNFMDEMNIQKAANKADYSREFTQYKNAKNQRIKQQNTKAVESPDKTIQSLSQMN